VQVFFVISGFVIAYSIRDRSIDGRFIGRFAWRRLLRLDPPYWASLALAVTLTAVARSVYPDLGKELPSAAALFAHLAYAQELLGFEHVVYVYWTLCLEVQFYVLLVLMIGAAQEVGGSERAAWSARAGTIFAIICLLSMLQYFDYVDLSVRGLFLPYWFYFALGASVWWAVSGELSGRWLLGGGIVLGVFFGVDWSRQSFDFGPLAAGICGLAIWTGGRRQRLARWWRSRVLQYLGTVSYSLYLVHPIVGWRTVSVIKRLVGPGLSPVEAVGAFFAGIGISVLAAHVFYVIVERPSLRLSRRVVLRGSAPIGAEAGRGT
jgi:peptidoglycan/LPS O-acetylase OafA/YrhL